MPKFEATVTWLYGKTVTVEAKTEDEAEKKILAEFQPIDGVLMIGSEFVDDVREVKGDESCQTGV